MKLKNIILGLGLSLLMNTTFAQGGLEGIVVERYYQTNAAPVHWWSRSAGSRESAFAQNDATKLYWESFRTGEQYRSVRHCNPLLFSLLS